MARDGCGEVSFPDLALDLHRHEREENRHQPVVNPHQQRLRDDQPADLDRQRNIEQARVKRPERRICAQQGNQGGDAKGNPAGCFQLHELLQPGLHAALLSAVAFESCRATRAGGTDRESGLSSSERRAGMRRRFIAPPGDRSAPVRRQRRMGLGFPCALSRRRAARPGRYRPPEDRPCCHKWL